MWHWMRFAYVPDTNMQTVCESIITSLISAAPVGRGADGVDAMA
jgi:hypothetical protein